MSAALISGVVLLLATRAFLDMAGKHVKLRHKVDMASMSKAFTSQFTNVSEGAEVAIQFEHLPIPTSGCATTSTACLRQISSSGTFSLGTAPTGFTALMSYFTDESSDPLQTVYPITGNTTTTVKAGLPVLVPASTVSAGDLYMTWMLTDETTPAFVIMHSLGENAYMTFDSSTKAAPAYADRLYRMHAENHTMDPDQIVDQLVAIYNTADPRQYQVQIVTSATLCSGGAPAPTCTGATADHWQVGLQPVSYDANFASGFVPTAANLGITIGATMQFQDGNYLLASGTPSIYDSTSAAGQWADLRGWAYSYASSPTLVAAPIQMTAYYLRKVVPSNVATDTYYSLVASDYSNGRTRAQNEHTLVDRLPMTCAGGTCRGKVIFGRKVGGSEIGVWIYKPDDTLVTMVPLGRLRDLGRRFAWERGGVGRQPWFDLGVESIR